MVRIVAYGVRIKSRYVRQRRELYDIVLNVVKASKNTIETVVKVGGYISSHKGVNLPNTKLKISAVTEKDKKDIKLQDVFFAFYKDKNIFIIKNDDLL